MKSPKSVMVKRRGTVGEFVLVSVPAWKPGVVVRVPLTELPPNIWREFPSGAKYTYAKVNYMEARTEDELVFSDWGGGI